MTAYHVKHGQKWNKVALKEEKQVKRCYSAVEQHKIDNSGHSKVNHRPGWRAGSKIVKNWVTLFCINFVTLIYWCISSVERRAHAHTFKHYGECKRAFVKTYASTKKIILAARSSAPDPSAQTEYNPWDWDRSTLGSILRFLLKKCNSGVDEALMKGIL